MKRHLVIIGVALLGLSSAAQASPIFSGALGLNNTCPSGMQPTTSSTQIFIAADWTCGINPLLTMTGAAIAGPGILGVSASGTNLDGQGNPAFATAAASLQGIFTITGPPGGLASVPEWRSQPRDW